MRLYVPVLALLVLHAHAASINNKPEKRTDDLDNIDLDDVSEPKQTAKNDGNIPVAIVEEGIKKVDENSNDYIPDNDDSANIKRVEIDLENPGLPQRQEHETQNPENFSELDKGIAAIKLKIEETKNIFKEEVKKASKNFETLFTEKEDLPKMLESVQSLKSVFTDKIEELGQSIKENLIPDKIESKSAIQESEHETDEVQSELKLVEKKFQQGVRTLNEGVELLSIIREEDKAELARDDSDSGATAATPVASTSAPIPQQGIASYFSTFQETVVNGLNSLSDRLQSYISNLGNQNNNSNNQQSSVQSDEPASQRPTIMQQIQSSLQNLINRNQTGLPSQNPQYTGPFANAVNGIVSIISPSTSPAPAAADPNSANPSGSAVSTNPQSLGPIQNIIQNNPIVKGIQQAVQRIQNNNSATAPEKEKPREPVKKEQNTKGYYGGHGNLNNQGDNNDNSGVKSEEPELVESVSGIVQDSELEEPTKEAISPPAIAEKTE